MYIPVISVVLSNSHQDLSGVEPVDQDGEVVKLGKLDKNGVQDTQPYR